MAKSVVVELIGLGPSLIWAGAVVTVVLLFRSAIRDQIVPRLSRISAFGVEVEVAVRHGIDRAATDVPAGTDTHRMRTARRAARLSGVLRGARILLVNDVPSQMDAIVAILAALHIEVDVAGSTSAALDRVARARYDAVLSDMVRGTDQTAGTGLIGALRERGYPDVPVLLMVTDFRPERGVPAHAFGITNRVDEILNLLFDALERTRG